MAAQGDDGRMDAQGLDDYGAADPFQATGDARVLSEKVATPARSDRLTEARRLGYAKKDCPVDGVTGPQDIIAAWCEGLWQRYADDELKARRHAPVSAIRKPAAAKCPIDTPAGIRCKFCGQVHKIKGQS